MGWPVCNSTSEYEKINETAVYYGLTFHQLGLLLSAITGLIAIVISFYLIMMHATHYLRPWEQRHIIRILFMIPVYATVSFLSYLYYQHSIYFETLRDCYEAFAIAAFFTLLCHYVAEDLHQQKNYFRTVKPKKWFWPLPWLQKCFGGENGPLRTPRSGLTWFNVIWVCVFQYCFVRIFFTIVAVVTQYFNLYCEESLNPAFSHIWVMGFESVSVSAAMYGIIQFYIQLKDDIADHKPILKVLAIKLVIFLSFWQSILISFLTSSGVVSAGPRFGAPDIKIGIPAMLLCVEMACFAVFHLWAFSWLPYRIKGKLNMAEAVPGHTLTSKDYKGGFLGIKALADAFNPWDLIKAVGRSFRWLFVGRKHRTLDASYNTTRLTMDPASFGNNSLSTQGEDTSYRPAGKPGRTSGEEGEELLMHAQTTPASGPPPAYSHENAYEQYPAPTDIGLARSNYGEDGSNDNTSHEHSPMPYSAPPISNAANKEVMMPTSRSRSFSRPNISPERWTSDMHQEAYPPTQQRTMHEPYHGHHEQFVDPRRAAGPGAAVPYPDQDQEYDGNRQNRISMPRPPGPNATDRGGGGNTY